MTQKHPQDASRVVEAPPYKWSSDVELPVPVKDTINNLLAMAASCHATGIEMRQVWFGIDADGDKTLYDTSHEPNEVIPAQVMMMADKKQCVALVMCSEGYGLPQHVAKQWAEHPESRKGMSPSEHPEHFEVLMVQVETKLGTWHGQAKIIGQAPNQIVRDELVLHKVERASGRLNNLLPCNQDKDMAGTLHKILSAKRFIEQFQKSE